MKTDKQHISTARGLTGISPVAVFLVLYVAVSLAVGDFYRMPFSVALLAASAWGIAVTPGQLTRRIEKYSRAAAHSNIIYMIWIFILAGAFAALAKETGCVEATVGVAFSLLPAGMVVPGLFAAACFISLAVGTSVGTVVALAPLAAEVASSSGIPTGYMLAVVLGGSFFGDNLSFISDTTIAATRSQGCEMADKFRANVWLALPAAVTALGIYAVQTSGISGGRPEGYEADWLRVVPYLLVIITAALRMNVTIVLTLGISAAFIIALLSGSAPLDLCGYMGGGIEQMGSLIVITLMSAGMLGLVKECGGITWIMHVLTRHTHGQRGAKGCIALLVGIVNLCTANNTVAIITVGSLSKEIAARYGIPARKSASLLDTCSCIVQCLIPYGAQTLLATSLAGTAPTAPFPYMYYPWALSAAVAAAILIKRRPRSGGTVGDNTKNSSNDKKHVKKFAD